MRYITVEAAIKELQAYCVNADQIEYEPIIAFLQSYFDFLPKDEHGNYCIMAVKTLETAYMEKMPYPADILKVEAELARIKSLHGKMRTVKEGNIYKTDFVLQKRPVSRPSIPAAYNRAGEGKAGNVTMDDEFTYELKYQKDVKTALLENSIDEYLEPFKDTAIDSKDYSEAAAALKLFFEGHPPTTPKCCAIKNRNKKKLGYALGQLYKGQTNGSLSFEYLDFCRRLFDCFKGAELGKDNYLRSNLYKYFSSKTQH